MRLRLRGRVEGRFERRAPSPTAAATWLARPSLIQRDSTSGGGSQTCATWCSAVNGGWSKLTGISPPVGDDSPNPGASWPARASTRMSWPTQRVWQAELAPRCSGSASRRCRASASPTRRRRRRRARRGPRSRPRAGRWRSCVVYSAGADRRDERQPRRRDPRSARSRASLALLGERIAIDAHLVAGRDRDADLAARPEAPRREDRDRGPTRRWPSPSPSGSTYVSSTLTESS